ncbi:MAG: DNA mismatch repair protein MutS [Deltaproteobacteria bacterium]|nr:DNA mismatch repair protein MutS [Deltaproteobacteria bacterium]
MSPAKTTPMMNQYLSIKGQYPDAVLFYRMGDFYEMFFEDAERAAAILDITLTSRNKNVAAPIPMCGVPHKAAQGYIARLLDAGLKVAVCDQVEDPATAKGLVKREVVRVITPGMIVENDFLEEKSNNFILAIAREADVFGLASLDLSTGAFRVTETDRLEKLINESQRIAPSEIVLPASLQTDTGFAFFLEGMGERSISYLPDGSFDYRGARSRLLRQFETLSLEGFGCEELRSGVQAAGALLAYVQETQKQEVRHVARIETYGFDEFLWIDDLSSRNLELVTNIRNGSRQGTLLSVLDRSVTAMGGRLLKTWLRYPSLDAADIEARLDAVAEAKQNQGGRKGLRETLKSVSDLERLGSKITMGHCNARDLLALKGSLMALPEIVAQAACFVADLFAASEDWAHLEELAGGIAAAIREDAPLSVTEGGMIKTGYDAELDELVRISRDGKGWLARLEVQERESTGITALKVRYNKVFGYFIEVPKSRAADVPTHYVRKQTLVNAERYITEALKTFETKVLNAEDQRATLEYALFQQVRRRVIDFNRDIQSAARFIARIDCLLNLAEVADQNGYCRPVVTAEDIIDIVDGRHPVIEKVITGERFVPNSIRLDDSKNRVLVITGPNMAGKSTVLRQVALLVLMAHMGSFVPAHRASVGLTDRIFTRVGALDNLSQGQSTFLVEMQETANILNNATGRSLVILDEIGRGTSTFDGLSIAWAVAEYLHDLAGTGVKTLFATHYHELTELARTHQRVQNFNIAVKEWNDEIIFLRKLVEGGTNRSYGIQVARLAGIPRAVVKRAKKILAAIESGAHPAGVFADGAAKAARPRKEAVQLSLFHSPESAALTMLKRIDITRLTPLEALNCLDRLCELAKGGSG